MPPQHDETHRTQRIGWLRAAVLGANDGIVSTASLILGVAAAEAGPRAVLVAGLAGLVGGAMSMAAGEYVSVSSQADVERADLRRERGELATQPEAELAELAGLYVRRGVTPELAHQVAVQLTAHDPLAAHAREELGISESLRARPLQAAATSAGSFAAGALIPLAVVPLVSSSATIPVVAVVSLLLLGILGWIAAKVGGARPLVGAVRVLLWSALAMALTAAIGAVTGTQI